MFVSLLPISLLLYACIISFCDTSLILSAITSVHHMFLWCMPYPFWYYIHTSYVSVIQALFILSAITPVHHMFLWYKPYPFCYYTRTSYVAVIQALSFLLLHPYIICFCDTSLILSAITSVHHMFLWCMPHPFCYYTRTSYVSVIQALSFLLLHPYIICFCDTSLILSAITPVHHMFLWYKPYPFCYYTRTSYVSVIQALSFLLLHPYIICFCDTSLILPCYYIHTSYVSCGKPYPFCYYIHTSYVSVIQALSFLLLHPYIICFCDTSLILSAITPVHHMFLWYKHYPFCYYTRTSYVSVIQALSFLLLHPYIICFCDTSIILSAITPVHHMFLWYKPYPFCYYIHTSYVSVVQALSFLLLHPYIICFCDTSLILSAITPVHHMFLWYKPYPFCYYTRTSYVSVIQALSFLLLHPYIICFCDTSLILSAITPVHHMFLWYKPCEICWLCFLTITSLPYYISATIRYTHSLFKDHFSEKVKNISFFLPLYYKFSYFYRGQWRLTRPHTSKNNTFAIQTDFARIPLIETLQATYDFDMLGVCETMLWFS